MTMQINDISFFQDVSKQEASVVNGGMTYQQYQHNLRLINQWYAQQVATFRYIWSLH